MAEVLAHEGSIQNFFRKHMPSENGPYGIMSDVMESYVKSCGELKLLRYDDVVIRRNSQTAKIL